MNHLQAVNTSAPERYLLEEMSELERHAFEDHYFSCADCAEDVRLGALLREGAKAGLMDASVVSLAGAKAAGAKAARARTVWRPSVFIPWAAAAMLALVAGAQSLMLGPGQNRLMQPLALAPITLRQASRGAEPVVPRPAGAAAITLAVIVDASRGPQLEYDVRAIGGKSVASGPVAAPQPGVPLLLLIPAWTLTPAGHYILSIHRASDGDIPDEYRFAVRAE
jgi:hypothetical protein